MASLISNNATNQSGNNSAKARASKVLKIKHLSAKGSNN